MINLRDLLGKNLLYKLVAVFLAVVLWMNASDQDTSLRQLVVDVPLEMRNLSSSLVAGELPETVRVRIEGEWSAVEGVDSSQFSAFVALDSLGEGNHQVPIQVTVPQGVRLVNIYPANVSLRLTEMTSVTLPVTVDVEGRVAVGYTMLSPVVEPAETVISGPKDVLEQVTSARVQVNISGATGDYNSVLPITLVGAGSEVNRLTVSPATARVTISVIQEAQTKTVNLEAVVEGNPQEGFTVGTVSLAPATVDISGAPEILSQISVIKTLPVSVEGKEASFTESVAFSVPEGVRVIGRSEAAVTVEILEEQ